MIKKLISLMTVVGIACTFLLTAVMADIQQEDFGEYPVVLADMNFDDLDTGTVIDKDTDPDKYFFKDDNGGPGGTDDEITPAVEIVEAGDRKYAKVTTYTNANEAFGISPKVTQDSLVENGLTEYPDKIKVEYDVMKDGHSQAVYGFIGYASPIANATKDWGEFMQWGSGNTFSFARQMSTPVTSSTAVALGNWAHVDLYIDFTEGTFDCFVNETYIGKADLKPGMTTPEYLSFSCYTNNKETSNLCVDNIKISAPAPEFVVKGSSPADGASIFEEIQIEISNDIVDFDYSNDMEVKCNGEDVAFEATEEDGIITVILKEGLEFGDRFIMNFDSNYVVKLNNTFCDTYGQTLAEPYEYTFRTTERTLVSTVPAIEDSEAVSYVYNPSETDSLTAKLIVSVTYNDGTSALYIDTKEIEPDKFKQLMVNISDLENVNKIFAYVTKDADTLKPLHYMYATADGAETFIGDTATVATVDRADIIRNKVEIEGSISVKEKQDIILIVSKDETPFMAVPVTTDKNGAFKYSYFVDSMPYGKCDVSLTGYNIQNCEANAFVYLTDAEKLEINNAVNGASGDPDAIRNLLEVDYKDKILLEDEYYSDNVYNALADNAPFESFDDMVDMIFESLSYSGGQETFDPYNYGYVLFEEDFEGYVIADNELRSGNKDFQWKAGNTVGVGSDIYGDYIMITKPYEKTDIYFRPIYTTSTGPVDRKIAEDRLKIQDLSKMQVSFDFKVTGNFSYTVQGRENLSGSSKTQDLFNISGDGKFKNFLNSSKTLSYEQNTWYKFDYYFDFDSDTYTLCINDEEFINEAATGALTECVESIGITTGSSAIDYDFELGIDNYRIAIPHKLCVSEAFPSTSSEASILDEIKILTNNYIGDFDYERDMEVLCDGNPVPFEATASDNVITVKLLDGTDIGNTQYGMVFDSEYTIRLKNTFSDKYGQKMAEPYEYKFTTMEEGLAASSPVISNTNAVASVYNPSKTDPMTSTLVVIVTNTDGTSNIYMETCVVEPGQTHTVGADGFDKSMMTKRQKIIAYVAQDSNTLKPMQSIYVTDDGTQYFNGNQKVSAMFSKVKIIQNKVEIEGSISAKEIQDLILTVSKDGSQVMAVPVSTDKNGKFKYSYTVSSMPYGKYTVDVTGSNVTECESVDYVRLTDDEKSEINNAFNDSAGSADKIKAAMDKYKDKICIDEKYYSDNTYDTLSLQAPFATYDDAAEMIFKAFDLLAEINATDWSNYSEILKTNQKIMLANSQYRDTYLSFTDKNKNKVNLMVVESAPFSSFEALCNSLDDAVSQFIKEQKPQDNPRGPGGGGGFAGNNNSDVPSYVVDSQRLFEDVENVTWASFQIKQLHTLGVIAPAQNFRPYDLVTREEFVKMLVVLCNIQPDGIADFADISNDAWYVPYIAAAKASGIVKGDEEGNFGVGKNITRQDMVVMAKRAVDAIGKSLNKINAPVEFVDRDKISDYAIEAVSSMQQAGIISGVGDGHFDPLGNANRAQAAVIIYNIINTMK